MLGLNALGNALTPEAPQQEEESSDPENEWRPGEGNVPFQVRGVRSFNPQQISPSGVEQNWISTTPAQPYVRKYAAGGQVNMANMQEMRMQHMRPFTPTQPEADTRQARKAQFFSPRDPSQPLYAPGGTNLSPGKQAMFRSISGGNGLAPGCSTHGDATNAGPVVVHPGLPRNLWRAHSHAHASLPAGGSPQSSASGTGSSAPPEANPAGYAMGGEVEQEPKYKTDLSMLFGGIAPMIADGFRNGNKFGSGLLGMMFNERKPWEREVKQMAMGGPVGITQGMEIPQMANPAPMGVPRDAPMPQMGGGMGDQELIMMAAQAIKSPTPESQQILEMFVQKFGPDALQRLSEMVNPPIPENMGRLLKGPGTGTSDSIPAVIDGSQPAALSTGEFVVPAKAVSKLGKGSTDAGAQKLQNMVNKVSKQPDIEDGGVLNI